jgi:hypothetical protein
MNIITKNSQYLIERTNQVCGMQTISDKEFKRYESLLPEFKSRVNYLFRKREQGEWKTANKKLKDAKGNVVLKNGKEVNRSLLDSALRKSLEGHGKYLYGLRFSKYTRVGIIDIDNKPGHPSKYHSSTEREKISYFFKNEYDINVVWYQSSNSGGWHGYIFLSSPVLTFSLACFLKLALSEAGFELKGGTLETYPNIKSDKHALYLAIRCPCAEGFGADVKTFIADSIKYSSKISEECLEIAREQINKTNYALAKHKHTPDNFKGLHLVIYREYMSVIDNGWTNIGQTGRIMYLLITKGKKLGLFKDRSQCFNELIQILPSLPGYNAFCRHTEDLDKRLERQIEACWHKASEIEYEPYKPVPYEDNKNRQVANNNDDIVLDLFSNEKFYKKNGTPNLSAMSKASGISRITLTAKWDFAFSIINFYLEDKTILESYIVYCCAKMYTLFTYTLNTKYKCIDKGVYKMEKVIEVKEVKVKNAEEHYLDYVEEYEREYKPQPNELTKEQLDFITFLDNFTYDPQQHLNSPNTNVSRENDSIVIKEVQEPIEGFLADFKEIIER